MLNLEPLFTSWKATPLRIVLNILGLSILVLSALLIFPETSRNASANLRASNPEPLDLGSFPIIVPTIRYGFALDTFEVKEGAVQKGEILGKLLHEYGVSAVQIEELLRKANGIFRVQDFQAGKPYLLLSKDMQQGLDHLVYEPSLYEYYIFHLRDSLWIEHVKRPVEVRQEVVEGIIESSLWNALESSGASPSLIAKLEDALQWSIDFHHLQKGDQFRAVYDQNFVEGTPVDPGRVHAALYKTEKKEHYAIYYEYNGEKGYYDLDGRPINKGFLKAPVKFSRISSYYNLNRLHPILKYVRPHFGTDYAAPAGTEIYAVGAGEILEASYTSGNGNYVKIKHNNNINTQYLHMKGFAKGIRKGVRVSQGQVIGYVGSTGLATGPHVCFRFWMNGKQVNHLKFNFPPPDPLPAQELEKFIPYRDQLLAQLREEPAPRMMETAP